MNENEAFEISHDNFLVSKQDDLEHTEMVLTTLNKLPTRQKETIYLKIYKGLNYEEISEVMNINYQVVRNLLCQALKLLKSFT